MKSDFIKRNAIAIFLFLIVVLAGGIRFYQLDTIPVSLYWDEVAIGYNAYAIAETGRDEHGEIMPMLFTSFHDFKSPGYIYLTSIFVKLFGLNELSVRFGSALLGTATVFLSYFLVLALFSLLDISKKQTDIFTKKLYSHRKELGILTTFLLAISPWHIQFSRAGFEANAGLFMIVLGSVFLFKNIPKVTITFFISAACFALSFYFYRSLYIFTPLFLLGNSILFRKELYQNLRNKYLYGGAILFFAIVIPFIPSILSKEGMKRAQETSIKSVIYEEQNQAAITRQKLGDPLWARILYDRRLVSVKKVVENYAIHLSPKFLFLEGDTNARHRTITFGEMYLWEMPFLLLGIVLLFRFSPKVRNVVILWILAAPVAASFSIPTPHALRTLTMLPMPQLLVAMGILFISSHLKKTWMQYVYYIILFTIITFFFVRYAYLYTVTVHEVSREWGDGYRQLTEYVFQRESKYDKIIISGHYWQPYIYFLFYKKYDPNLYVQNGSKHGFDKYTFGGTSWDQGVELENVNLRELAKTNNALVALSPKEYAKQNKHIKKLTEIRDHHNEVVFIIGELRI